MGAISLDIFNVSFRDYGLYKYDYSPIRYFQAVKS